MEFEQSNTDLSAPLIDDEKNLNNSSPTPTKSNAESYHGKASLLSTGMLFGHNPRGIVDSIPHPNKPCLLFSDWCPIGQCAYMALLEKEWQNYKDGGGDEKSFAADRKAGMKLFTVVHVCDALAKHEDPGSRLLKKLKGIKGGSYKTVPNSPVFVHDGNIIVELSMGDVKSLQGNGLLGLLLPGHIDEALEKRNSLRPDDAVDSYNMNLVSIAALND